MTAKYSHPITPASPPCTQEPRLAAMEAVQAGILENLKDIKHLLASAAQSEDRIRSLRAENQDQEKRLRALEISVAQGRWMERLFWLVTASGVGLLFTSWKGGGGQ